MHPTSFMCTVNAWSDLGGEGASGAVIFLYFNSLCHCVRCNLMTTMALRCTVLELTLSALPLSDADVAAARASAKHTWRPSTATRNTSLSGGCTREQH